MGPRFRMGRRRGLLVGAAVGAGVASRRNNNSAETEAVQPASQVSSDTDEQFAQLQKLGELKDQGILTQEEFDAKKKQILGL